jgi:catechol 2,3-dioxygenase-like lactoylglutathione lyase family enzyme
MRKSLFRVFFYILLFWSGGGLGKPAWAQNAQRPLILGISHVAFRVKDLTKTTDFYQGLLGYKAIRISKTGNHQEHIKFSVNIRQHIEIYPGLPAGQDERMLEVAFEVTDANAMRLYLLGKGVKVPETLEQEPDGTLSFVVQDPEKHLIKFIQHRVKKKNKGSLNVKHESAVSDRILHVGITVSDVKNADAFYQDILGFSEIWRGGRPDNVTNWINMKVPEGTDYVEYMLVSGQVNRQQLGVLHHVALQVPSIQNALDVLRNRVDNSAPDVIEAPRIGRNNRWQLNLYDPEGTRVELMEPFPMR